MSEKVAGVLRSVGRGVFVVRDPKRSFSRTQRDVFVGPDIARKNGLVEGAYVVGTWEKGNRGPVLTEVESVCGLTPEEFKKRKRLTDLTVVDPDERFDLGCGGDKSMRVIDLVAPIARGTRALIVAPPRSGKTVLLEKLANSIAEDDPDCRVIVLLIDERPEEVTSFKRSVKAEVYASTSDSSNASHVELTNLMLENIKTDLECGRDIVVLVDSLTRMGRAFNQRSDGNGRSSRVMSGGMGVGAMEIPRRFFGLARNIEDGGSITIIATALVDTGSRMDQLIFEEFKGTGNCEIILDRRLAQSRIYPAIDILASGTRKEENLYGADDYGKISSMRRILSGRTNADAINTLLGLLGKYPTNTEFLDIIPSGQ